MANQSSGKTAPTGGVNQSSGASYSDVRPDDLEGDRSRAQGAEQEESDRPDYYTELGQKHLRTGEAGNQNFFPDPRDLEQPRAEGEREKPRDDKKR